MHILPISLVGLILALFVVPSKQHAQTASVKKVTCVESFRQVFTDRSATACLAGSILSTAGVEVGIFGVAFYRQRFSVSVDWIVLLNIVAILIFAIGSLVAGRLTNRLGAKPLAVTSTLLTGIFTMTFFMIPNIWGALFFDFLHM